MLNLKTQLRHKLKSRRNPAFVKFMLSRKKPGEELHHLLGSNIGGKKISDLLIVSLKAESHQRLHYKSENNFEDMLIEAIENLCDYIEYLQRGEDEKKD